MAKKHEKVCPGCSRHCAANHVHCKYGRKYFEKLQKKKAALPGCGQKADSRKYRFKWEKYVEEGSLAWKLLWTAGQSKRALRRKKLTGQELLAALDEAEREQLRALLEKISGVLG